MPISKLMTVAEVAASRAGKPHGKGVKRSTLKRRKDRAEAKQKKSVRAQCVDRDGHCRAETASSFAAFVMGDAVTLDLSFCDGPSEWAHMHAKRRAQTRGQAPEVRHTTEASLMLCRHHHQELDAHRLEITPLTAKGCDGPLRFSRKTPKC